ncbi:hydantoinase B/oxoprolinase family protein [Adhaeretor mobilis]|uniref:Acetophenone carboxylase gamma subunit n=1 Tax=Adhaeretor mobilis TaxID=1930276 RepID=A0A517MWW9_9BACT|nr:hydantoinase B/oxoprolinase family protein [Adhaeretor mobilis]QDS99372.1 Acetophenone carboxylase gamma subunit [Adhaeretor mobilis]
MAQLPWQFWIDVGGTFTDCMAKKPNGELLRHKLLSSGATKGQLGMGCTQERLVDSQRQNDPPQFWDNATLALLNDEGDVNQETTVDRFDNSTGSFAIVDSLSTPPQPGTRYELRHAYDAPVLAIRYLLGLATHETPPPVLLRLGTTRGTNALLTRTGANTALVVTHGFGDVLRIGYQDRPRLFDLAIKKRVPLTDNVIEIAERIASAGEILIPLDESKVKQQLVELKEQGIGSLAICLMHADLNPEHELVIEHLAREVGFAEISRSSEVSPLVKMVARGETTLVDAYLNPVLRSYFTKLQEQLPGSTLRLMTSSGGLTSAASFRGCQSVLSGPAGGVVGYTRAAELVGYSKAIGFDMGGTSTDVSRYAGSLELDFESEKAGVRLMTPTLAIETIAAGGGSICWFDGVKLQVGPDSAGADPGPACYGRGGPLTVTDVNLLLGRVIPDHFPFQLDIEAARSRIESIAAQVFVNRAERLTPVELAEGFLKIANTNMAGAIRNVTIAKGVQPEGHLLVAFGGAAAQHACAVADELDITEILHHPDAGILSAYGIGMAEEVRGATQGVYQSLATLEESHLTEFFNRLAKVPIGEFAAEGVLPEDLQLGRSLEVHYTGSDTKLLVPYSSVEQVRQDFEVLHKTRFGYTKPDREIQVASARLNLRLPVSPSPTQVVNSSKGAPEPAQHEAVFAGERLSVDSFQRDHLPQGFLIAGPALITQTHTVVVIEHGWEAEMLEGRELLLRKLAETTPGQSLLAETAKPQAAVELEIFNNLLVGVAERMGHVLRRTAVSVNVKERLDFSCAVFTAEGKLVANAPHVPVHLGAMGVTVRCLLAENPDHQLGDVFISNDPYRGGSHFPDITMVLPVHDEQTGELLFCTACRAHHAEIGGVRPGSMPPNSTSLSQEGVLISNFLYRRDGKVFEEELQELLTSGDYPSRSAAENIADLAAQAAAVERGARGLKKLVRTHGRAKLLLQMKAVQAAAELKVRQVLAGFPVDRYSFTDYLETASGVSVPICVAISINSGKDASQPAAIFDFTGTGPVVSGNLNANPAIVTSAVLYSLRLLVDEDIPLNEGVLDAVEIILPQCLLNPAPGKTVSDSPAVAAGNVETSQRVVDVLLGAFGVAAASQGTMNNVLFGDDNFGYYETLGGGSGATLDHGGADAVQVHMTNTRSTDPEVLERRLPVRLWEMGIRKNSGGTGKHSGGNGMRRKLEFLRPLKLSLITSRRGPHPPFGLEGGGAGECGRNRLIRADGSIEELPGICEREVEAGDMLEIQTPGGGGFGVVPTDWQKVNIDSLD